jgi:hypothetical protein
MAEVVPERPRGDCILRSVVSDEALVTGSLHADLYIDHADPRVLIADEVLAAWRQGDRHPALTLDGDLVKIRARNRTVVYRLVEHVPQWRAWIAEWPD